VARRWQCDDGDLEEPMGRYDLTEVMAALRVSIARLADAGSADDRALHRALAHLWSAHDELELFTRAPIAQRAS
jgi:hypothetical protein